MSRRQRFLNPAQLGFQVVLDARFITGVADGAAVSTWSGRAGTTVTATQGTGINQPTYQATGLSGGPAVRFDGSNDFLTINAPSLFQNVASGNIWAVVRDDNVAGGDATHSVCHFSTNVSTAARATIYSRFSSTSNFVAGGRRLDAGAFASSGTIVSSGNATVLCGVFAWGSGTLAVRVNGVQSANGTFASGAGNTSNTTGINVIGAVNATTQRTQGDIAAIFVVTPSPSASDVKRVEQILALSFKIAIS